MYKFYKIKDKFVFNYKQRILDKIRGPYDMIEIKEKNKKSGITLIALVVTIVVLLIIAGVSIRLTLGNNGIISRAMKATETNKLETLKEDIALTINSEKIDDNIKAITGEEVYNALPDKYRTDTNTYKVSCNYSCILYNNKYFVNLLTPNQDLTEDDVNNWNYEINEYEFTDGNYHLCYIGQPKNGNLTNITFPDILVDNVNNQYYLVVGISHNSFEGSNITSIDLSSSPSIKRICYSAFENCTKLQSIVIPETCEAIEGGVFSNCKSLSEVNILSALKNTDYDTNSDYKTALQNSTFSECLSLRNINLPENLELIAVNTFYNSGLKEITIPKGCKKIDSKAFLNCESLLRIQFDEDSELSVINSRAFDYCHNVEKNVYIPTSVTLIGDYAFRNCGSDKNITIYYYNSANQGVGVFEYTNSKQQ